MLALLAPFRNMLRAAKPDARRDAARIEVNPLLTEPKQEKNRMKTKEAQQQLQGRSTDIP